jgi:hypothetical protein
LWKADKDKDDIETRETSADRKQKHKILRPTRRSPEKFNTLSSHLLSADTQHPEVKISHASTLRTHRKSVSLSSPKDFPPIQETESSSSLLPPSPKSKDEHSAKKHHFPLTRVGKSLFKALTFSPMSGSTIEEERETESETNNRDVNSSQDKETRQQKKGKHKRVHSLSVAAHNENNLTSVASPLSNKEDNDKKEKEKTRNPLRLLTAQISSLVRHDNSNKESSGTAAKTKLSSPRKHLTRSSSSQGLLTPHHSHQRLSEVSPPNSPTHKEPQIKLKITKDMLPEETKALYKDIELQSGGVHKIELTDDVRYNIATEIVVTERSYNQSLAKVIQCYLIPLREAAKSSNPILTLEEIKNIFGQWEVIYGFSCEFLRQLEDKLQNWDNATQIGNCFLQMADFLKIYAAYFNNYTLALQTLNNAKKNPAFVKFASSEAILKQTGLTTLADFLVMPVQRIPRYILLLNELKKRTAESHSDFAVLAKAIDKVQTIANQSEAMQKEVENIQTIVNIQQRLRHTLLDVGYRRYIKEGSLKLIKNDGSHKERYYFLFNDILIEALQLSNSTSDAFDVTPASAKVTKAPVDLSYQRTIPLLNLTIQTNPDTDQLKNTFTLVHSDGNNTILCAASAKERDEWVITLETVIKQLLDKEFSRREKFKKSDIQTPPSLSSPVENRNS